MQKSFDFFSLQKIKIKKIKIENQVTNERQEMRFTRVQDSRIKILMVVHIYHNLVIIDLDNFLREF
jgi:hypothetical protein